MKNLMIPVLAGTLFLGGCADLLRNTSSLPVAVVAQEATIVVRPQVVSGGFTAAAVPKLTASSINHLLIQIFELDGAEEKPILDAEGNEVSEDLTSSQLANLITFSKLKPKTNYRIRAFAYRAAGTDVANLISTTDSGSYVDVQVLEDDRPTVATLKVKLIDVDFDGQASFGGVTVTEGGYLPAGPVGISINDAAPAVGEEINEAFMDLYRPGFVVGMTWTYLRAITVGAVTTNETITHEITGIAGNALTMSVTTTPEGGEPQTASVESTISGWFPPATTLLHTAYETITVPAETYMGAAKLAPKTNTATDWQLLWLSPPVGLVKMESAFKTDANEDALLSQTLTAFSVP